MSHANAPKRPKGRSLTDFENLSDAEKKLIDCAVRGDECRLGEEVPKEPTPDNVIRPELIRFLALGGDENTPVHEKGVQLRGAWIGPGAKEFPDELDFDGASLVTRLALLFCFFPSSLSFRDSSAISLSLAGSVFRGFYADRLKLDGGLFLRRVHAEGPVRLLGAEIGGDLTCSGGHFEGGPSQNKDCIAIACDSATIGGSVFLNNDIYQNMEPPYVFHAIGEVRLSGVRIGGDLDCSGGQFENGDFRALTCERTNIGNVLFFRGGIMVKGKISFAHAKVATLVDDINCWTDHTLVLDGFRYDRIAASSPLDAKRRIAWLEKQQGEFLSGDNFALQPWTHLAKVLREQGHFREAAEVDIAREERLRAAGKIGDPRALLSWAGKWGQLDDEGRYVSFLPSLSEQITYWLHGFYGWFSDYGHRPIKIVYYAMVVWFVLALLYAVEADNGHFTLANSSLTKPAFNPWAYSLDLILPVVQLGEFAKWSHVSDGSWRTLAGWTGFLIYFEKIFGWIAALTLAAIAAGLVKRKDG